MKTSSQTTSDRLIARQHGAVFSDSGYALAFTHSHAIVWPYAANTPSPETFTFALPYPSKHTSDPLPLGSLVLASASSPEPGLVVVIPNSGKITYWESIASAATLDLIRQQRNGVEMSISGMLSGETVVQILNAETAGFILAFSSGRLAYMSVRDGQGRPAISVQFLRGGNGPISSGIFGSIRNALSNSALRGDIAAMRAGQIEKIGERNVVVATKKGKLQFWNIHRGGHNSLQAEADGQELMTMAMKEVHTEARNFTLDSFEVLDFTYTPKSVVNTQLAGYGDQEDEGISLLVLASLRNHQLEHYYLIEVVLEHQVLTIGAVRPIRSYTTPVSRTAISKTRLYLPNPALVAYVVFDRAVVVLSMAKQPDSPDSQLRTESHILLHSFEDVIDFRGEMNVEIVGSGMEEPQGPSNGIEDSKSRRYKAKHPAAILIVRAGGVIRVAATDIKKLISDKAQKVTAKSKLEQAVFYGTIDKNPLSFAGRPELYFSPDEVGEAALELSDEILKSTTEYIGEMPASIDLNLRRRAAALQHLAEHLRATGVALSRATRWKLLCNAEKMAAAIIVWTNYDASIKKKPEGHKRGIISEIVESIHERYKSEPVHEAGELDRIRHWFQNDVWRLEIAVPWAYQVIKYSFTEGRFDATEVMSIITEGNDLLVNALDGAFTFRTANLALYGLHDEQLENGILKANYEGLPELWTSYPFLAENARKQADLSAELALYYLRNKEKAELDPILVEKLRHEIPAVVDVAIRSNMERIRWNIAQNSPELHVEAEEIRAKQAQSQDQQITLLATDLELPHEAIALAEKHRIMPTLASVIVMELSDCADRVRDPGMEREEFKYWGRQTMGLQDKVKQYFTKFGASWATALYEHQIEAKAMAGLFDGYPEQQKFLTEFLRDKPEYAKLAWIHEVIRERDVDEAARTLLDLGLNRERDLWSKKIELSLGTLARMAGRNYSQSHGILIPDGGQTELAAARRELGLTKIQRQIYEHVLPSIEAAIDDKAEVQLALEAHSNKGLKDLKRLSQFLEEDMACLVKHEALDALALVDLLTLMDADRKFEEPETFGSLQFYLALQSLRYGTLDKDEQILVQRVVWRRCMLKDDWAQVNNTDSKSDQQAQEQLTRTALYTTFRACFKNRK
jgi:nuclear pore complex protein Nup133